MNDFETLARRVSDLESTQETLDQHLRDALNQFQAVSLQLADYGTLVHQLANDLVKLGKEIAYLDRRMTQSGLAGAKKTCPEHGNRLPCPCGRRE